MLSTDDEVKGYNNPMFKAW